MIFYPNTDFRLQIRKETETELRSNFNSGTYFEIDKIATILKFLYDFHYEKICNLIKGVNSRNAISFLLFQYEIVSNDKLPKNKLPENLVLFKETILFLIDLLVENKPYEASSAVYFYEDEFFNKIWIHAENAIEYSSARNFSQKISKADTQLIIFPENSTIFISHNLLNNVANGLNDFDTNRKRNIELRDKYLNGNDLQKEILAILYDDNNIGFKNEFGITYLEFEHIILTWVRNSKRIKMPKDIPCLLDSHIASISDAGNISKEKIETLFKGLTLNWFNYKNGKREIWNYVQQERSRKRPLIEINYDGKHYRLFSPQMLGSRICDIGEDFILSPQNRLPKEWDKGIIKKKLALANNKIGKWFEYLTIDLLNTVNVIGFKPGNRIRLSTNEIIQIDSKIGPPDFIGYSPIDNAIIVIECKLLDCAFESKGIQSELLKFLEKKKGKKNYTQKFKEKIDWVNKNHEQLKRAIEYTCKILVPEECTKTYYCFVTYYPTTLRYFYTEIPSPTLVELVDLYLKRQKWPFEFGKMKVEN